VAFSNQRIYGGALTTFPGVIALGVRHAERIDLALRSALESVEPDVEAFFAEDVAEPFFVKNLERV
jgi:hypothetical protein